VHEKVELVLRPFPIFTGQTIQGQLIDMETRTFFDRPADTGDTSSMTFDPRQITPLSPSPIAVHDDGDMARPAFGRDLEAQGSVRGSGSHNPVH
jgi:hypothetical protein